MQTVHYTLNTIHYSLHNIEQVQPTSSTLHPLYSTLDRLHATHCTVPYMLHDVTSYKLYTTFYTLTLKLCATP